MPRVTWDPRLLHARRTSASTHDAAERNLDALSEVTLLKETESILSVAERSPVGGTRVDPKCPIRQRQNKDILEVYVRLANRVSSPIPRRRPATWLASAYLKGLGFKEYVFPLSHSWSPRGFTHLQHVIFLTENIKLKR